MRPEDHGWKTCCRCRCFRPGDALEVDVTPLRTVEYRCKDREVCRRLAGKDAEKISEALEEIFS